MAGVIDGATAREVAAWSRSAITGAADAQTIYVRYETGGERRPTGEIITSPTKVTSTAYPGRVHDLRDVNAFALRGVVAALGGGDFAALLQGKAVMEFATDLGLESLAGVELLVSAEGKYAVYRPLVKDEKLVGARDFVGDTLVTYYVAVEYVGVEEIA